MTVAPLELIVAKVLDASAALKLILVPSMLIFPFLTSSILPAVTPVLPPPAKTSEVSSVVSNPISLKLPALGSKFIFPNALIPVLVVSSLVEPSCFNSTFPLEKKFAIDSVSFTFLICTCPPPIILRSPSPES